MDALPRHAFASGAEALARRLLGCRLRVDGGDGVRTARIVETEAYVGEHDLACHASRGRTRRTESLYGPPGTAYVYLVYGLHRLFNVVAADPGDPQAVLIRAVEPLDFAARTHGPGLASAALGIELTDDRTDLVSGRIRVLAGDAPERILVGPRIGVDYAGAWADAPLRFGDAASERLSRPFPGGRPRRRRAAR